MNLNEYDSALSAYGLTMDEFIKIRNSQEFTQLDAQMSKISTRYLDIPPTIRESALVAVLAGKNKNLANIYEQYYTRQIPSFQEFISEKWLPKTGKSLFPTWKTELTKFFDPNKAYFEAIFTGAIGTGKSTAAMVAQVYNLMRITSLTNPQMAMGVAPTTQMTLLLMSILKGKAYQVLLSPLITLMGECPAFLQVPKAKMLEECYKDTKGAVTPFWVGHDCIMMPNNVFIQVGSQMQHAIGAGLFGACLVGETLIPLTNGTHLTIKDVCEKVNQGEDVRVFGWDTKINEPTEVKVLKGGCTGRKKIYKVTLDSGEVRCTGNHPFLLMNGDEIEAKDLRPGDRVRSMYINWSNRPEVTFIPNDKFRTKTLQLQRLFASQLNPEYYPNKLCVHHLDKNSINNTKSNLVVCTTKDHYSIYHKDELSERMRDVQRIGSLALSNDNNYKEKYPDVANMRSQWCSEMRDRRHRKQHEDRLARDLKITITDVEVLVHNEPLMYTCKQIANRLKVGVKHIINIINEKYGCMYYFHKFNGQPTSANDRRIKTIYEKSTANHKVVKVEEVGNDYVYDITVSGNHNFAICDNLTASPTSKTERYLRNKVGYIFTINSLDEAEFRRGATASSTYELYYQLKERVRSRFIGLRYICLTLMSSVQSETGMITQYAKSIPEESPHTVIYDYPIWEVRFPNAIKEDGYFYAMRGNISHPSRTLSPEECEQMDQGTYSIPPGCKVIKVPKRYQQEFNTNVGVALKNLAGMTSVGDEKPFSDTSGIEVDKLNDELTFDVDLEGPNEPPFDIGKVLEQAGIFVRNGMEWQLNRYPDTQHYIHNDLAQTGLAGISLCHKELGDNGKIIFVFDFILRISTKNTISFEAIRKFYYNLKYKYNVKIHTMTFDQYQSTMMKQYCLSNNIAENVYLISVDRTAEAYYQLANAVQAGQVKAGKCPYLREQLDIIRINNNKPYAENGVRKDVADSVAGGVFNAINNGADVPTVMYNELTNDQVYELVKKELLSRNMKNLTPMT